MFDIFQNVFRSFWVDTNGSLIWLLVPKILPNDGFVTRSGSRNGVLYIWVGLALDEHFKTVKFYSQLIPVCSPKLLPLRIKQHESRYVMQWSGKKSTWRTVHLTLLEPWTGWTNLRMASSRSYRQAQGWGGGAVGSLISPSSSENHIADFRGHVVYVEYVKSAHFGAILLSWIWRETCHIIFGIKYDPPPLYIVA